MRLPVCNEKLLDFLLYSYFGCEREELEQKEKEKCAYRAYLDLSRRIEYRYSSNALDNMKSRKTSEEDKNLAKKYREAKKALIEGVCNIILCPVDKHECVNEQSALWHKAKCKEIKEIMNAAEFQDDTLILKSNSFTYGLAQKWVNMTLKYLWLLDRLPEGLTEKSLHVPIDSFILEKLQEENVDEIKRDGDTYKYKGESWSQLYDYVVYLDIQKKIRQIAGKTIPIEWEGSAWMDIAKKRSNE